jgi:hypothetical protein
MPHTWEVYWTKPNYSSGRGIFCKLRVTITVAVGSKVR